MKRIALVTGDSTLTGVPFHVLQLAKGLKAKGFDILIIAPTGKLIGLLKKEGLNVAEVPMHGPLDWNAIRQIEKQLHNFNPHIVHTHGMRAGWLGRLASRNIKCKKIYTEHLWTPTFHLKNRTYEKFQLRGLKFMDRYTDVTIAVSQSVKDFLVNQLKFDSTKIHVIPNGINPRFLKAKLLHKPKDVPVMIGTVGSLNNSKNHQSSIKAVAKVIKTNPKLRINFQIIGEGPARTELEKLIESLGVKERIQVSTKVDDILDRFQHYNIYLNTSLSETFGLAVGEAMALGLPVIASNIPALKYLVGDAGILVSPKDIDAIAENITKLAKDEKMRKELGIKARKRIKDNFSEKVMVDKTAKLYNELVS